MVVVAKFGGTSAKDGETLEHVINNIILTNPERRVIVVSAPGKRNGEDTKVTDLLIRLAEDSYENGMVNVRILDKVKQRYAEIAHHFRIPNEFVDQYLNNPKLFDRKRDWNRPAYIDKIKPIGEIVNAEILAEAMRRKGLNASVYGPENIGMVTNGNFGNAKLLATSYSKIANNLSLALSKGETVVVPGFYGVDKYGRYTTFPRGGSGLTGAILANALDANLYENWTDTDGIMRADPRIVDNPEVIKRLTYREARELAYSGAEILHPDTLIPLIAKNIPLHVRNTFNQNKEGTYIGPTKDTNGHIVEGIAHKEGFAVVYVEKTGMNEETGYLSRLTKIFADNKVSIDQMTTSIDSIAIAVSLNRNNGKINQLRDAIVQAGLVDSSCNVKLEYDKAMICVVGEGMRHTPGVLEKLSHALASNGINIETVYQGPSERSVIFGLDQSNAKRAVQAIYNLYFSK